MPPVVLLAECRHLSASPFAAEEDVAYRYLQTIAPAEERWPSFLAALAAKLSSSGLGGLSDAASDATGDVVVTLRHWDYGRRLVDECLHEAEFPIQPPIAPQRWRGYACDEYFTDNWWEPPPDDSADSCGCLYDLAHIHEDSTHGFLAIGTSSCDGIHFGYRQRQPGLWVYYPVEDFFKNVANTVAELVVGWRNGTVSV